MSSSVWPKDILTEPPDIERDHANHLIVFLISPFNPKDVFDEIHQVIQLLCAKIGKAIGAKIDVVRADSVSKPGVIHKDIWTYINGADAIVADVTGNNGNVMLELGVAASYRNAENVIIIRDSDSDEKFLFDISPSRHLMYKRGIVGDVDFHNRLGLALQYALAPAPFVPHPETEIVLPVQLDLSTPTQGESLIGPSNEHRRYMEKGLEFGSLYVYRYSWLTLGQESYSNVRVQVKMKFSSLLEGVELGQHWMGIMLRSQHFYAEAGHLIYIKSDGVIQHTQPINEGEKDGEDPILGKVQDFETSNWIEFDLSFSPDGISGKIGEVEIHIDAQNMPFIYSAGLLRFQTYRTRSILKTLKVESLSV